MDVETNDYKLTIIKFDPKISVTYFAQNPIPYKDQEGVKIKKTGRVWDMAWGDADELEIQFDSKYLAVVNQFIENFKKPFETKIYRILKKDKRYYLDRNVIDLVNNEQLNEEHRRMIGSPGEKLPALFTNLNMSNSSEAADIFYSNLVKKLMNLDKLNPEIITKKQGQHFYKITDIGKDSLF